MGERSIFPSQIIGLQVKKVKKGKVFSLQAGVAQRVGRAIAVLFHDRGTRRG
jgi:hypothetical protein